MHPVQALFRTIRTVSPSLGARIRWEWSKRRADFAMRVVDAAVRPGAVVVDVGAHWGLFTSRFAEITGPTGEVHAIEPNPIHMRSLTRLKQAHGNIRLYDVAVSDSEGRRDLHVPLVGRRAVTASATLSPTESRSSQAHRVVNVRTTTLDALFLEHERAIAFLKCDVEGHEHAVITGGAGMLKRFMPTLLIEIEQRHRDDHIGRTFRHLVSVGYDGYALFPGGLRPVDEFDVTRDQLAFLTSGAGTDHPLPASYVHDFLFVRNGTDMTSLSAPADGPPVIPSS